MNRILYWFRNDLRLHDNEGFLKATQQADEVIPVFIFDPRIFEKTSLGFRKIDHFRAKFIRESVADLRDSLQRKGGDLVVKIGEPKQIIGRTCRKNMQT